MSVVKTSPHPMCRLHVTQAGTLFSYPMECPCSETPYISPLIFSSLCGALSSFSGLLPLESLSPVCKSQ